MGKKTLPIDLKHLRLIFKIVYFEKYNLNINKNTKEIYTRFKEPSERNFKELFNPRDGINELYKREFLAEAHKRLITPLIILIMTLLEIITTDGSQSSIKYL